MGGKESKIVGFFPTEPNSYPRYSNATIGERKGFDSQGMVKMKKGDARWAATATSGICPDCKGDCPPGFVSFGHHLPGSDVKDTLCQRDWAGLESKEPDRKIDCCSGKTMGVSNCPPGYSVGSNICLETMKEHCPSVIDGKLTWDSTCDDYINVAPPQQTNDLIETAVTSFFDKHKIIETPQIPFGKTLQTLCGDRPGLCDNALRNVCGGVSRDLIENDEGARQEYAQNICGCFLKDTPGLSDYGKYEGQVPKECDPICKASKIQAGHRDGAIWVKDDCRESNCIIDNTIFNLINSNIGGGMNVQQVCGNDGKTSTFECLIGDVGVNMTDSEIIGKLNLCETCKGGIKVNPKEGPGSNAWISYDCTADKKMTTERSDVKDVSLSGIQKAMIWGLIALVIVGIVILYLRKRR
jgi:hypothetical protein